MKILVVHEVNYYTKPTYEFQIMVCALKKIGHEVEVVDYPDLFSESSLPVRILERLLGGLLQPWEVWRRIVRWKPERILLYSVATSGLQTLLLAKLYHIPVTFRSIDVSHQLVHWLLRWPVLAIERLLYRWVDDIAALTPQLATYCGHHARVVGCPVDTDMFRPTNSTWYDPVVLFAGTLYNFSGLISLIHAWPKLLESHPKAHLMIVGAGPQLAELEQLDDHTRLWLHVTGHMPYEEMPRLINLATVCINPFELNATTELIMPTKILQYMACGKPTLATPLPGMVNTLDYHDGVCYSWIGPFVDNLVEMLNNEAWRLQLAVEARYTALQYKDTRIASLLSENF